MDAKDQTTLDLYGGSTTSKPIVDDNNAELSHHLASVNIENLNKSTHIDSDDLTCANTINVCARLTADSICCAACCCFCGGCCGMYHANLVGAFPNENISSIPPGHERFISTCLIQSLAGCIMPSTFYGCFWGLCGACAPLANKTARCVLNITESNKTINKVINKNIALPEEITPPKDVTMSKT